MARLCLIVHDLTSEAGAPPPAWDRLAAAAAEGHEITVLHTQAAYGLDTEAIVTRLRELGARYCSLNEFKLEGGRPIFPAVEAHRLGCRIAQALEVLQPELAWWVDHPAHAAATAAARQCGAAGLESARLVLEIFSTSEFRRSTGGGGFPIGGREAIATEFLERRSIALADEVVCADPAVGAWTAAIAQRGTNAPGGRVPPSPSRVSLSSTRVSPSSTPVLTLPTVSVCVPFYEKADELESALASLAAQTQPPHEVIVIDDGSASPAAAAAWREAAARYEPLSWRFVVQANAGPAAARNRGALEATGEAVLFCDADNRFRPDMIAALARGMAASGADVVTCGFAAFSDQSALGTTRSTPEEEALHVFVPLGPCFELGLLENVLGDTNSLFRRQTFLDAGGFVAGLMNEDWRLLLEWVQAGRSYATLPVVLFDYRVGPTSRSLTESEFASASAVIAPLIQWEPAMQRLWPHLAGLVRDPQVLRLQAELAPLSAAARRLTGQLAVAYDELTAVHGRLHAAQIQAEAQSLRQAELDKTLAIATQANRVHRAHIFLLERLADEQRSKAVASSALATELRVQLAAEIARGGRDRAAAEATIAAQRGRMERMQASFSWRSTAWLRALRRRWLDRPPPAAPAALAAPAPTSLPILHHIDAPRLWSAAEPRMTIRGWTFPQAAAAFQAVRARIGPRSYAGTYRMERPDLAIAFPQWPSAALAGFKVEVDLLPGDTEVALDGQDESGTWHLIVLRSLTGGDSAAQPGTYAHWLAAHPDPRGTELESWRAAAALLPPLKISVLVPVYNPAEKWLIRALESVCEQTYPHWELCIADDASTAPHVRPVLERFAARDARIKVVFRTVNGHISAATNSALELATGEFTALFDHDDELPPHALQCVAAELASHPAAELVYTDEDKIDEGGTRFDPHFKPDWNPELLCAQNYISHLSVFRTRLLRELGGLRTGFEGSQDWDLILRATERLRAAQIRHIPRVLYHWRANEGSTALHLGEKSYIADSARRALSEHFQRTGEAVTLERTLGGHWHVGYPLPRERPLVSIIIPTRNAGELVQLCVASIIARTNYAPFEILLIDNRSDDPASLAIFAAAEREDGVRVLRYDAPFNYSAIQNFAARAAQGDVLCLLNNDIEVLSTHWLDEMVALVLRPGTGAVGARLYYPDLRVQHAGVITGLGGVAGHGFKHFERSDPGTAQFRPHLTQNLTAVTAACLVIRKAVYFEAGGFDEAGLAVAFNDVDFCLKVDALGYRNVYAPFAELMHHESASRGREDTPEKIQRFQAEINTIKARWGQRLLWDPAYNPNLTLDSEDFGLAYPPRVPPLV